MVAGVAQVRKESFGRAAAVLPATAAVVIVSLQIDLASVPDRDMSTAVDFVPELCK